jgi:formylmethanofuran dehydrogenase subunit E
MKAKCSKCGKEYNKHSMVYVNGELVCASCYLGKTNDSKRKQSNDL